MTGVLISRENMEKYGKDKNLCEDLGRNQPSTNQGDSLQNRGGQTF